jgi:hypothetical protein
MFQCSMFLYANCMVRVLTHSEVVGDGAVAVRRRLEHDGELLVHELGRHALAPHRRAVLLAEEPDLRVLAGHLPIKYLFRRSTC